MKSIKHRVTKLEKRQGKGGIKFCMLTLYKGEAEPEIKDPDVFRLIMRLDCPRPADS